MREGTGDMRLKVRIFLIFLILLFITGCSAKVKTTLILNPKAKGTHSFEVVIDDEILKENKLEKVKLDALIKAHCPPNITYTIDQENDSYKYTFVLAFSSLEDYKNKVQTLVGEDKVIDIKFQTPNTTFSKGFVIEENFNTQEMAKWFVDAITAEGLNVDISKLFNEEKVKVIYDNQEYNVSSRNINVNQVKSRDIEWIDFFTTLKEDNTYHQSIAFALSASDYKDGKAEIDEFFQKATPEDAIGKWNEQDNYAIYSIEFDAEDVETFCIKLKQIFASDQVNITWSEESGTHAFSKYYKLEGTIDLSSFGIAATNSVKCNYQLDIPENLFLNQNHQLSEHKYQNSVYQNQIEFSYLLEDRTSLSDIEMTTEIESLNNINKKFLFTFTDILDEDKKTGINEYLASITPNAEVNVINQEPYVIAYEMKGEVDEVNRILDEWLHTQQPIQLISIDENLFQTTIALNENMDLSDFRSYFNYYEDIHYKIQMPSYGKIEIAGMGDIYQDIDDDAIETVITDNYMSYGIKGHVWKTTSIIMMLCSIVLLIPLIIVMGIYIIKKHAKLHDIKDLSYRNLLRIYGRKALIQIKVIAENLKYYILHSEDLFIHRNVNKNFFKYFYGSRWDFVLFSLSCILFLLYIMIGTTSFVIFALLLACIAVLMYEYSIRRKNSEIERQIDEHIECSFNDLLNTALENAGIILENLRSDPYHFTGVYLSVLPIKKSKDKMRRRILHWFMKQTNCLSTEVLKFGNDGIIRGSVTECVYLLLTKDMLFSCEFKYDVVLDEIIDEKVTEFFYENINTIEKKECIVPVISGKKVKYEKIHMAKIISKSGISSEFTYMNDSIDQNSQILQLNYLIREKREENQHGRTK